MHSNVCVHTVFLPVQADGSKLSDIYQRAPISAGATLAGGFATACLCICISNLANRV